VVMINVIDGDDNDNDDDETFQRVCELEVTRETTN
jgi:hypothetical protein